ncbi:MAG TPA: hypothetical protein IGS17_04765 [Oscillatoriales cyanobacterium M59_W2019_021]|nr:MAG: hypothetical protein D6728_12645 [Cyanobacteria bacterium J055]HIK33490.1 hypothetical protein [Oscillatoriales cyanobacterium M4454_W2019_049]HIK50230.1 hypothetical protein [Oscillatoriales cyanobacterium M59_W2019_021]
MSNWVRVKGIVKKGYGVASGCTRDPRFPQGTIEMQKPFFRERGLDLEGYFPGTINLSIAPHQYRVRQAKYTFKNIKWSIDAPAEDFSFFDCRIIPISGEAIVGSIYYPHPETKPEHFQSPDILELLAPYISDLTYGNELTIEVDQRQIEIT